MDIDMVTGEPLMQDENKSSVTETEALNTAKLNGQADAGQEIEKELQSLEGIKIIECIRMELESQLDALLSGSEDIKNEQQLIGSIRGLVSMLKTIGFNIRVGQFAAQRLLKMELNLKKGG